MPKRTIDDLLAAVEAVQILQETIRKHDTVIKTLLDKLERIETRLDAIEARPPSKRT